MKSVFLDTVGLLASWDTSDRWHDAAKEAFSKLSEARTSLFEFRSRITFSGAMKAKSGRSVRAGKWAVAVGLAGNILAVLNELTLWSVPPGTAIRPMGVACCMFLIAAGTACLAIPLAISEIRVERRWLLGILGIALAITPLLVSILVGRWIIGAHNLRLKP